MKIFNKLFQIGKMQWFFILFFSVAYSAVSIIGSIVYKQDVNLELSLFVRFVVYFLLCMIINVLVFAIVPKWNCKSGNNRLCKWFEGLSQRKLLLFSWIFIFVLWIPAYLILYPGVLSYDMISQVGSALTTININHHPVLHTWLIRVFLLIGKELGLGYEFGIGLFSLLQMMVLSYSLARLVCLLRKKQVPTFWVLLVLLMSAVWFMNACLSVTMIKDCLHAAFLVLFVCHFTEIVSSPAEYIKEKRNLLIFPIVSFLMCAFRNNGIYIYVFCFILLLFLRIPYIRRGMRYIPLVVVVCLPVLLYEIYTGPVFKAFNIEPGQIREALCIPIQQVQRTAIIEKDNLTKEQTELVAYYIDQLDWMPQKICNYDPFIADYAKSCFYSNRYMEDPGRFWKFYIELGVQYPKDYIIAFLSNTLGFWYPGYYQYSYVVYENYAPDSFAVPLERRTIWNIQPLKDYYESVCTSDFWRETPVLRLFFVPGFTVWFLLYAIALSWGKNAFWKKRLALLFPLIGQYGIMLLSPMSSFRYAWPFYLMLPVAFIVMFGKVEEGLGVENGLEN